MKSNPLFVLTTFQRLHRHMWPMAAMLVCAETKNISIIGESSIDSAELARELLMAFIYDQGGQRQVWLHDRPV